MKRMLSLLLAMLLVLSLPVTTAASSGETSGTATQNTQSAIVQTTVEPEYTVVIPSDVNVPFGWLTTAFGDIVVTMTRVHTDAKVTVGIGNEPRTLKNTKEETIPYTININNKGNAGEAFVSETYTQTGSTSLLIAITQENWNAAKAGTYTDTVTFTISYDDGLSTTNGSE